MSPVMLLVTDTDVSVLGAIVTHFTNLNTCVLSLLSCRSSELVSASKTFSNTAIRSDRVVSFEIIATGRDRMGMISRLTGSINLTNLSMNGVPVSSITARLSLTPKCTSTCTEPCQAKNIPWPMTVTWPFEESLMDLMWMRQMQSHHLTGRTSVRPRLGPARVS